VSGIIKTLPQENVCPIGVKVLKHKVACVQQSGHSVVDRLRRRIQNNWFFHRFRFYFQHPR